MEYNLINFDVLSVNEFKKTKLKSIFINAKILIFQNKERVVGRLPLMTYGLKLILEA